MTTNGYESEEITMIFEYLFLISLFQMMKHYNQYEQLPNFLKKSRRNIQALFYMQLLTKNPIAYKFIFWRRGEIKPFECLRSRAPKITLNTSNRIF